MSAGRFSAVCDPGRISAKLGCVQLILLEREFLAKPVSVCAEYGLFNAQFTRGLFWCACRCLDLKSDRCCPCRLSFVRQNKRHTRSIPRSCVSLCCCSQAMCGIWKHEVANLQQTNVTVKVVVCMFRSASVGALTNWCFQGKSCCA